MTPKNILLIQLFKNKFETSLSFLIIVKYDAVLCILVVDSVQLLCKLRQVYGILIHGGLLEIIFTNNYWCLNVANI